MKFDHLVISNVKQMKGTELVRNKIKQITLKVLNKMEMKFYTLLQLTS